MCVIAGVLSSAVCASSQDASVDEKVALLGTTVTGCCLNLMSDEWPNQLSALDAIITEAGGFGSSQAAIVIAALEEKNPAFASSLYWCIQYLRVAHREWPKDMEEGTELVFTKSIVTALFADKTPVSQYLWAYGMTNDHFQGLTGSPVYDESESDDSEFIEMAGNLLAKLQGERKK